MSMLASLVRAYDRAHKLKLVAAGVDVAIRETFAAALQFGEAALRELKAQIARTLASDEDLEPPCELTLGDEPDLSDLRSWCVGFLEGVFLREEDWFRQDEETVSELLLPIMVGSGLFEDQPEFAEIAQDEEMVQDMLDHIPDVLTQLYLLFQAPEEKGRPALLDPRH